MIEGELMGKLESERSDGRRRGGREGWARRYFCCFSFPNPASKRPEKIGGYVRYWQSFFSTGIMFGMRYVPFWMTSPRERSLWFSRFPALRIGDGSIAIASGRYSFRFGSVKLDFPRIFGLKHFCQAFWKIVMSNTVSFYPIDALNFILSLFLFFSLVLLSFFFFMRFYEGVLHCAEYWHERWKGILTNSKVWNDFFFPNELFVYDCKIK